MRIAGVIEAKASGATLSGVAEQSGKYMGALPPHLASWAVNLLLDYESTGTETIFRDLRDPHPRSRPLFAFHKPETLLASLKDGTTLRSRLTMMPQLITEGLRDCQVEAVMGLEASLARADPRALIQMVMGAGKTFTACTCSYRLIKHARAKRILFLVDRNNLGRQTLKEFQAYRPPDDGRLFTDLYNVQHLRSSRIDHDAKVVITTIQRLYASLRGEELPEEEEEKSTFEAAADGQERTVVYNPDIPIGAFDFVVTDECHRSIYGVWRQVLEYFDAFIIGLTATPSKHTLGYFRQNLVAECPEERSIADRINVAHEIYRIKTEVTERGSTVEAGYSVGVRDKRTRRVRYQELDNDLAYAGSDLDRAVTAPNQIRTVLETYRQRLFTELFPGRREVPKTLIFAKDDNHAEEIVTAAREVFGRGNDFAKKITYKTTADPEELIKAFRVDFNPRIAVTVDMIATGTDIKPLEVLIFMRDVKSETYYEQMKGRAIRSIPASDLKAVTPDADAKTRFVLIDAVGVTEGTKKPSRPMERKRTVSFDKLLKQISEGDRSDDTLSSVAARLAALDQKISEDDRERLSKALRDHTLRTLSNKLVDAIDPDTIQAAARKEHGPSPTPAEMEAVEARLKEEACRPFDDPALRKLLADVKQKTDIIIDDISTDKTTYAGFDMVRAQEMTGRFRDFIEENKDELLALQILYSRPYGSQQLTHRALLDLAEALSSPPWHLLPAQLWLAYWRLDATRVANPSSTELLTDLVSLVRFALGKSNELVPFAREVEQKFNLWIGRQIKAGRSYSDEQMAWLRLIKEHIAANVEMPLADFQDMPQFSSRGGIVKARHVFGTGLNEMLAELQGALVG